jgi:CheY-like chemotaxis protein
MVGGKAAGRKTILLVEDDPDTRFVFAIALAHQGYYVVEAENGALGIERALQLAPDLIVLDIAMPSMSGIEAARRLRADPRTAKIPLFAVSGNIFSSAEAAELKRLFDECFEKPISPLQLQAEIRRVIGPPTQPELLAGPEE